MTDKRAELHQLIRDHGLFDGFTYGRGQDSLADLRKYEQEFVDDLVAWHEQEIAEANREYAIEQLQELIRNGAYTSSARKVDYVPIFRLEDRIEALRPPQPKEEV